MSGLWQCAGWHHVQPGMVDIVVHLVGTRRVKLESFREAVAQASDGEKRWESEWMKLVASCITCCITCCGFIDLFAFVDAALSKLYIYRDVGMHLYHMCIDMLFFVYSM